MPTVKVSIKWGKDKFDNVELDTALPVDVLKAVIFSLTSVPPARQKVAVKGKMLKDDMDLAALNLKDGALLTLMGTVGDLPKEPPKQVLFLEDMTVADLAQVMKLPPGLQNLGNTCYMNATLQCLRAIPELQTCLATISETMGADSRRNIPISLRELFKELTKTGEPVMPMVFLTILQTAFPQFGERGGRGGGFMQQDAEECWVNLITCLRDIVPGLTKDGQAVKDKNFVDQFMTADVLTTMKCEEAVQEETVVSIDHFSKLSVNISAGINTYLLGEIANSLTEKIEKTSLTLNRTAVYTKTGKFTRLPQYLTVSFVRFQWKQSERLRAKILKKVKFPFELDLTSYCVPELITKMQPAKQRLIDIDDKKKDAKKRKAAALEDTTMDTEESKAKKTLDELYAELNMDPTLANDVGANVSGIYDLVAVLTHAGRTADAGHYMAWVKKDGSDDDWWKFDDDKVAPVKKDEIEKLDGGGDWHSAYICLYRAKDME